MKIHSDWPWRNCDKCGTTLEPTLEPTSKFDGHTGQRIHHLRWRCPNFQPTFFGIGAHYNKKETYSDGFTEGWWYGEYSENVQRL